MTEAESDDETRSGTLVGKRIAGRYRVERLLGRGGMGAVYAARTDDGQSFALKVIRPEVRRASGQDAVRRFLREARAVQQIDSPYVTRVVDAGTDDEHGFPFLVMELLVGRDLATLLRERGALEPPGLVPLFVQACTGLAAAHARGIVHRDIKPANLFVEDLPNGDVGAKVCDFGVAKLTGPLEEGTDLTQSGGLLGSPMYMSPEQARSAKNVDHRSDIFSLAVSLYEGLCGRRPWHGSSAGELVLAMWSLEAVPLGAVAPWIEPGLARTIHRALARLPGDRFASAEEFAAALAPFGVSRVSLGSLVSLSEAKRLEVAAAATRVWSEAAVATTMPGSTAAHVANAPAALSHEGTSSGWLRSTRFKRIALGLSLAAGVAGIFGVGWAVHVRAPARWWSAARPTMAVPYASASGADCPAWLSGAVSLGVASQLGAGGKVRVLGPRSLAEWADPTSANGHALRDVLGADAVVETRCTGRGSSDSIDLDVRVSSTDVPPRELAAFEVAGRAAAPSALVTRLGTLLRTRLGLEPAPAEEAARGDRTLPASPEAVRAYVEGVRKMDAYDVAAARPLLEKAVAREPRFAPAHAVLTEALAYVGQQTEAAAESALATENAADLPSEERLVVEGDAAAARFAWDEAIEAYAATVKVFPDRTDVALKLVQVYLRTTKLKEARRAIDALLARGGSATVDPRLAAASARVDTLQGNNGAAVEEAGRARATARAAGMRATELSAMMAECVALTNSTHLDQATASCADAEALAETLGDPSALVTVLTRDAFAWSLRADFAKSQAINERALAIATREGNRMLRATTLIMRANIEKNRGNLAAAIADGRAALADADESGNAAIETSARILLAGALLDSGVVDEAGSVYEVALAMARKSGNESAAAIILQNLASYWLAKGDIAHALTSANGALEIQKRLNDERDEPWSLDEIATIEIESGEPARAKAHLEEAIALRMKLQLPASNSHTMLSVALLALGDLDAALRESTAAADELQARGSKVEEAEARLVEARALLARGEVQKALAILEATAIQLKENGGALSDGQPARARALFLAGKTRAALALVATLPAEPLAKREVRLVADEIALRQGQREHATHDLEALASEAHAAGDVRIERAANGLIAGKLDEGYR